MLRSYFSVALRHLRSQFSYTALNVAGLAIGMACFALIAVFVRHELSFDDHYDTAGDIARVEISITTQQGTRRMAQSPPAWVPDIAENHTEIRSAVRVKPPRQKWMVGTGDRNYSERYWAFADHGFLDMFDIELTDGDRSGALTAPMTVVISESMARKYFGDGAALGRTLVLDNQYDFEVTGVMRDMPRNAHLRFDFLASMVSLHDAQRLYLVDVRQAHFPFAYTYIERNPAVSWDRVNESMKPELNASLAQLGQDSGLDVVTHLKPVTSIHLHSDLQDEVTANGSLTTVYIFSAIALFILVIACINFMNLATARSARRAREVGVRKSLGAERRQLIAQFLGESVLTALIALLGALLLAWVALPVFSSLVGRPIGAASFFAPSVLFMLLGTAVLVGLVAGSYPALYLSSFDAANVLKGGVRSGGGGRLTFRNVLVTAQFAISIALIVATVTVYQQMVYISDMNVGFDKEQVVSIELTDPTPASRYPTLRERMLRLPGVLNVSAGNASPAGVSNQVIFRPEGADRAEEQFSTFFGTDFDFIETFGMEVVAGRALSRDLPSDSLNAVMLNETAAAQLGWTPAQAVGRRIEFGGGNGNGPVLEIVGVVRDFHTSSARETIEPIVLAYVSFHFYAFARLEPARIASTLSELEEIWQQVVPGYEFDLTFIDDRFAELYQSERTLRSLLEYFASLTILIACLGLFGLASFAAERRRKEVGVRKALGASVRSVVLLLVTDLTRLVVPAFLIAAPVAWFAMDRWLSGFAYATDQHVLTYLVTLAVSVVIAVATVGWQSVRAARVAPVQSLRYE